MKTLITFLFILVSLQTIAQNPKPFNSQVHYGLDKEILLMGGGLMIFNNQFIPELIEILKKADLLKDYCYENKIKMNEKKIIGEVNGVTISFQFNGGNRYCINSGELIFERNNPLFDGFSYIWIKYDQNFTELLTTKRDQYYNDLKEYDMKNKTIDEELDAVLNRN